MCPLLLLYFDILEQTTRTEMDPSQIVCCTLGCCVRRTSWSNTPEPRGAADSRVSCVWAYFERTARTEVDPSQILCWKDRKLEIQTPMGANGISVGLRSMIVHVVDEASTFCILVLTKVSHICLGHFYFVVWCSNEIFLNIGGGIRFEWFADFLLYYVLDEPSTVRFWRMSLKTA